MADRRSQQFEGCLAQEGARGIEVWLIHSDVGRRATAGAVEFAMETPCLCKPDAH
jgi:hypothetical protein